MFSPHIETVQATATKDPDLKNGLTQLTREPLVQFLLIGACIYAAYAAYGTPPEDAVDNTVIVDTARIEAFVGQWQQRWNRPPTRRELTGLIDTFVREDVLYRQARAMGLDEDDPVTRRRMAQKLEFLTSDIALFKQPADGELQQYFEDHQARYRDADLITFSHVFFDPDLRDETTIDDATAMLEGLRAAGDPDSAKLSQGDSLMLQSFFEGVSQSDVQRQLGSGFAETVMQLEPKEWHGPVLSGFGVHLVYVYAFEQAAEPVFEKVEQSVLEDWQKDQQERFNADFYENLKNRYDVVIAEIPAGSVLEEPSKPNTGNEDVSDLETSDPSPAP
jgi:peptidyl-prolyl cis-trans isomerase C